MLVAQAEMPELAACLWLWEQLAVAFYVVELLCRIFNVGARAFFCHSESVRWNCADCLLVCAGVLSQWVLAPVGRASGSAMLQALHSLAFMWMLRTLRLVGLICSADDHGLMDKLFRILSALSSA